MAVIPHVADDQLIDTAWGNAVADALNLRGIVAFKEILANFNPGAPSAAMTTLVVPALDATRRYRITARVALIASTVAAQQCYIAPQIVGGSGNITIGYASSSTGLSVSVDVLGNVISGKTISFLMGTASGNVSVSASNQAPAQFLVEDVGSF